MPKGFSGGGSKGFSGGGGGFRAPSSGSKGFSSSRPTSTGTGSSGGSFWGGVFLGSLLSGRRRSNNGGNNGGNNNGGQNNPPPPPPKPTKKKCNYCGAECDINAEKCSNCGSSDFTVVQPEVVSSGSAAGRGSAETNAAEAAKIKSNQKKALIFIIIGVVLIAAILIISLRACSTVSIDKTIEKGSVGRNSFFDMTVLEVDVVQDGYYFDNEISQSYFYAAKGNKLYAVKIKLYNYTSYTQSLDFTQDFYLYEDGKKGECLSEWKFVLGIDQTREVYAVFEINDNADSPMLIYTEYDQDGYKGLTYGYKLS